jgi:DNA-binding FadR family transcriptional regulator
MNAATGRTFAALSTRDPVGALAAMRLHLKSVEAALAKNNVAGNSGSIRGM